MFIACFFKLGPASVHLNASPSSERMEAAANDDSDLRRKTLALLHCNKRNSAFTEATTQINLDSISSHRRTTFIDERKW